MIVLSPTDRWLSLALHDCSSFFSVSSPYVGEYLRKTVVELDDKVAFTLLTRTLLTDFASNASDLDAVQALAGRGHGVFSLSSLHAKVYVIDYKRALVTSANATFSGMHRNRECGVEVRRRSDVALLHRHVRAGFGSSPEPQSWSADDLSQLREPVERLRSALPKITQLQRAAIEAPLRVQLGSRQYLRLLESFSGWLRLTMEGVSLIPTDTFSMNEVFAACAPLASERFPENQHVREKLRQQMQRLRDLGLILFLGSGRYERTTRVG